MSITLSASNARGSSVGWCCGHFLGVQHGDWSRSASFTSSFFSPSSLPKWVSYELTANQSQVGPEDIASGPKWELCPPCNVFPSSTSSVGILRTPRLSTHQKRGFLLSPVQVPAHRGASLARFPSSTPAWGRPPDHAPCPFRGRSGCQLQPGWLHILLEHRAAPESPFLPPGHTGSPLCQAHCKTGPDNQRLPTNNFHLPWAPPILSGLCQSPSS